MKTLKSVTSFICSASIALTPMVGFAAGVDGGTTSTNTTPAVNSSANDAAKSNKKAEAVNYVASATEFAVAAQNWPPCYDGDGGSCATATLFTIMGILSMKQAKENGNKASQAYNTADLSDAYGAGNTGSSSGGGLSTDPEYLSAASVGSNYLKKAEAGLSQLQAKGLVNSSATKVTTPDGKTYNVSDMTSAAAMAAAGIPQGAIDAAMAASKTIDKKALEKVKIGSATAVNGIDEGGGMGGGSSRSAASDGPPAYPGYDGAGGKVGSLLDKDPSRLAAGMTKNYNGEPIGVAADSIFLMMSRRYKVKESQDSFFGASDVDLKK